MPPSAPGRRRVEVTIPSLPMSPNAFRKLSTQQRMGTVRRERDCAHLMTAMYARDAGIGAITGPARIQFTVYRRRPLDPMSNLPASLKHYQDGVCKALLPLGDGPGTPYTWLPVQQVKVRTAREERVTVTVEVLS